MNRFELDPNSRFSSDRRVLIGGSPLSLFRMSEGGARVMKCVIRGETLAAGHESLTTRLVAAGALHPLFDVGSGPSPTEVTLVIPVYGADPDRVRATAELSHCARTLVVDDVSPTPFPASDGIEVIRLEVNGGPGAARQAGLAQVTTPYVAFVDSDVTVTSGWIEGLLTCFADASVALAAPRVRAAEPDPHNDTGIAKLARFEAIRGPLDLGPLRARIRAASRVSYVPGAALVARTDALRSVGGFAPDLRLGEDVDLVWRLDEAGWLCRYEPDTEVHHDVRPTWSGWLKQRAGYGFSATDLALRHPGAVAPVQASVWSAVAWALPAAGLPVIGSLVAIGSTAALVKQMPEMPDRTTQALRLAGLGHLHAGRIFATALTRSWWPVSLAIALVSRRARRILFAASLVPTLLDWWKVRTRINPVLYTVLRLLDDGAYGYGLWRGAWARRSAAALAPDLTSWPKRPRYARTRDARRGTPVGSCSQ